MDEFGEGDVRSLPAPPPPAAICCPFLPGRARHASSTGGASWCLRVFPEGAVRSIACGECCTPAVADCRVHTSA
jgi:hypothetical protein